MPNLKTTITTNKMSNQIILICLCIAGWFISGSANAGATQSNTAPSNTSQLAQLEVTPKPCVALRKGQKCYLEVTFSWSHAQVGDYCLVNITTNTIMKCWQKQAKGELNIDFQSTLSNDFAVRKKDSAINLARTRIPVAWVYKSSKRAKSTWRLF
ncbi:DUF3019 domain-containing protein [Thalassotalea sp. ND16A]|uniref:DUF3019 domain-containing protein n=1 Tax=Thalassotalea sp. ND16A TaxID=1535422 RepID=UPI00051DA273|nr:DUF3019 domain-containing protein [Thalassotalea sp. ND16A]KGJ92428.1 hypothetical protein ND16A_1606 [Thalassotalea sp. ND16A]